MDPDPAMSELEAELKIAQQDVQGAKIAVQKATDDLKYLQDVLQDVEERITKKKKQHASQKRLERWMDWSHTASVQDIRNLCDLLMEVIPRWRMQPSSYDHWILKPIGTGGPILHVDKTTGITRSSPKAKIVIFDLVKDDPSMWIPKLKKSRSFRM